MAQLVKVGVVGGGMIAKAHVIALRALRSYFGADGIEADVVVVADLDEGLAREAARQYAIPRWTADWRELLADDEIDAITIATPNHTHAQIAVDAAAAGKHVLSEKPLSDDLESAATMVAAVESAGVVNSVNLNYRSVPAVQYAKRLIAAGELGEIVSFRGAFLQDWGVDPGVARSWKFDAKRAGAGPVLSVGCHVVDLAHYLTGLDVRDVVAATRTWITERPLPKSQNTYAAVEGDAEMAPVDVEDLGSFLVRFGNGAIGTIETSRVASGRVNHCFIEVNGADGSLVFDYETLNEVQLWTRRTKGLGFTRVLVGPEQDGGLFWSLGGLAVGFAETLTLHMRGFVQAIVHGGSAEPSFRDGLRAQQVIDAALRSAASGRWETVANAGSTR